MTFPIEGHFLSGGTGHRTFVPILDSQQEFPDNLVLDNRGLNVYIFQAISIPVRVLDEKQS